MIYVLDQGTGGMMAKVHVESSPGSRLSACGIVRPESDESIVVLQLKTFILNRQQNYKVFTIDRICKHCLKIKEAPDDR